MSDGFSFSYSKCRPGEEPPGSGWTGAWAERDGEAIGSAIGSYLESWGGSDCDIYVQVNEANSTGSPVRERYRVLVRSALDECVVQKFDGSEYHDLENFTASLQKRLDSHRKMTRGGWKYDGFGLYTATPRPERPGEREAFLAHMRRIGALD